MSPMRELSFSLSALALSVLAGACRPEPPAVARTTVSHEPAVVGVRSPPSAEARPSAAVAHADAEAPDARTSAGEPSVPAEGNEEPRAYTTPLLPAPELARLSREVCERARNEGRPILLELSADWCGDCRKLAEMKSHAPLRSEIAEWEWFTVNVGDGFQHPDVMRAFRVDAIAKLVVVRPPNCAAPLRAWRPLATRTLSDLPDEAQPLNESLTRWLAQQRASAR